MEVANSHTLAGKSDLSAAGLLLLPNHSSYQQLFVRSREVNASKTNREQDIM
jgi:hypothetical protein